MKNILRYLFIAAVMLLSLGAQAQTTIFEFTLNSTNVAAGTYTTTGGTAEATKAFATGGTNELTIGSQTYYKFNSSTALNCTLSSGTFAAGDIITINCACNSSSAKSGKGVKVSGTAVTDDFAANTAKDLTYTVATGDAIVGTNTFSLTRNDSDIKLGKVTVTRSGGTTPPATTGYTITYDMNGHGTQEAQVSNATALPATLPQPAEQGYTFDGWYTDAALSTAAVAGATISANTTLYAKWTAAAPAASNDATLISLQYNGTSVPNFAAATTSYAVTLPYGTTTVPTVTYTTASASATATITNATALPGATTVLVTAADGTTTKTYTINFTVAARTLSTDATLSSLSYNGTAVPNFAAATTSYNVQLPAGTTAVPSVTYTTTDAAATATVTNATALPGATTVLVTAENGTTTKTYTINFTVAEPVTPPSTTLSLHETEVYEGDINAGGYGTDLVQYNGREYEVYYVNRDADGNFSVNTSNVDKAKAITTNEGTNQCTANDNWFTLIASSNGGDAVTINEEFGSTLRKATMSDGNSLTLRVKGYDEFAFVGMDKKQDTKGTRPTDNQYFEVRIDGVLQPSQFNTGTTIRRYSMTGGQEHIIEAKVIGTGSCKLDAFSLRTAYIPKVKYIEGNDSSQVVNQTQSIKGITYFVKNKINPATISWNGATATGIDLQAGNGDTIYLAGQANCPNGLYQYTISATDADGVVVSSLSGKFTVKSELRALTDTSVSVFQKSPMQDIQFRYYSINASDLTYSWVGTAPAGLSFTVNSQQHTLSIGGTPTTVGTYHYTVSLADAETFTGTIIVEANTPTVVPGASKTMLYLYKSNKTEGLFTYLSTKYNYFARPAGASMLAASDYSAYDFVVISEDVDATNEEVLGIIRSLNKPVLNMKIFTYTTSRLGWGNPNNGSLTNTEMHIIQSTHPIFQGISGTDVAIVSGVENNRGLMPAEIKQQGGICLATAPIRGDDYDSDGEAETFIHEVPASVRGAKYLTLPIGNKTAANLTANGKKLVDNMITYLCGTTSFSANPVLKITAFTIDGISATIDDTKGEINITLPLGTDLTALTPQVTLADATTHVTPGSGETVDLSDYHYGLQYVVSDFINKKVYTVRAIVPAALDDITDDGLWMGGLMMHNDRNVWVNIYSINGQKITTTNSDFDFVDMPQGMYLIVSESSTIKVVR